MSGALLGSIRAFREALAGFDPGGFSGEECVAVVAELATVEKACAGARVWAAARAGRLEAHRAKGFADTADWLARESGTSVVEAKTALETAEGLQRLPEAQAAWEAGELSLAQAAELVKTESECPGSAAELLDVAKGQSLRRLREEGRRRRLEATDAGELHRRQHAARSFRHWRTGMGMVGFAGELPPEIGLPIVNRLDAECDRLSRRGRQTGSVERRPAHAADAFVQMVNGSGKGKARSADLVIVCDLRAFRRGRAGPGEPCHVIGGGPVPVRVVRDLARDAFLKAVLHDGVKIDTVAHFGRHLKAELRTALELGPPPGFEGVTCAGPECDRRHGLEWDHIDPRGNQGPTAYGNLQPLCWPHHQEKTAADRRAGLIRGGRPRGPDPP